MNYFCYFIAAVLCSTCYAVAVKRDLRCGSNTPMTTNNGVITSHAGYDHGHHYGKNLHCVWTITAPVGKYVELVADNFSVSSPYPSSCLSDYVQLFDGDSVNSPSLGKFCGRSFLPISSNGNSLTLLFRTTSYAQYGGFRFHYNFTDKVIHTCPQNHFMCTTTGYCLPSNSYLCDGDDDCGDDSDEKNTTCIALGHGSTHHTHICLSTQFACGGFSRRCIPRSWVCDGQNDCHDSLSLFGASSDEKGCPTRPSIFAPASTFPPVFTFRK